MLALPSLGDLALWPTRMTAQLTALFHGISIRLSRLGPCLGVGRERAPAPDLRSPPVTPGRSGSRLQPTSIWAASANSGKDKSGFVFQKIAKISMCTASRRIETKRPAASKLWSPFFPCQPAKRSGGDDGIRPLQLQAREPTHAGSARPGSGACDPCTPSAEFTVRLLKNVMQ